MDASRKNRIALSLLSAGVVASVVAALAVTACSSDDNPAPSSPIPGSPDASTTPVDSGGGVVDPNCTSDASACNSCVTSATDPYNACSSAAGNCVPFDETRVPKGTNGEPPQVP